MSLRLTRSEIREGLPVGLIEDGTGQRWRGIVHSLTPDEVHVWIPGARADGTPFRPESRGFLISLTFSAAEAGAMWIEYGSPERPTGRDLLAYWSWAKRYGLVNRPSAAAYLQGARAVLASLPNGFDTDLRTLDVDAAIAGFARARREDLAPASVSQYASGFRRAIRRYLGENSHSEPPPSAR